MANLPDFTTENFAKEIAKGNWVVDFWAEWCGACKMLTPAFAAAASSTKNAKFGKVNIDSNGVLAEQYAVMNIPTMLFFKNGKLTDRIVGVVSKETIIKKTSEIF